MTPSRPSVLVVQPLFAHYRYQTFVQLAANPIADFSFAAGDTFSDGVIQVFPSSLLPGSVELVNRWWGNVLWQSGLVRLILSKRYTAIVVTGSAAHLSTWIAAIVARLAGTKVLFWTTGWHRQDKGIKRIVRLTFYRLAHHLLLYNYRGLELGARAGYPRNRMSVIYNSQGSPSQTMPPNKTVQSSLEGLDESIPTVIAIVRLNTAKRLDQLIEAASLLRWEGFPINVILAGEGPDRTRLRLFADSLGVRLILPGAVYDRGDLGRLYGVSAVTVVPGPIGLTAIQSLQFGVPVISNSNADSQVAEWEAIKEGVTGCYFERDDVQDLARSIRGWITSSNGRTDEIEAACKREYQERWTPVVHAERFLAGLDDAFARNTRTKGRWRATDAG